MTDRRYAVWTCEEGESSRFCGLNHKKPCGKVQIIGTRKLTSEQQVNSQTRPFFGQCVECGRKRRLNQYNVDRVFETREDAEGFLKLISKENIELTHEQEENTERGCKVNKKYKTELVEWDHISVCTEGMDETQKDMLMNVIYALTKQRPRDHWGTYVRNPMGFSLTSSSQSVCGCRNCYQKEE